uniref:Uncharacterized protein n=2 Tax=Physcomitrium patens TaxID=3218 RepID=A0A7I4CUK2_PHYPA
MEKESELPASQMRGESGGAHLKPVQPSTLNNATLKPPQANDNEVEDDDGNDCISLKEWQPTETTSSRPFVNINGNGTSYSAWLPVKENKASPGGLPPLKDNNHNRSTPLLEINGDVCIPHSIHRAAPSKLTLSESKRTSPRDQLEDGADNRMPVEGFEDHLKIKPATEPTNHVSVPKLIGPRPEKNHRHHSTRLENGIPSSQPAGRSDSDNALDDRSNSMSLRSTESSRGCSLRVSFINEVMLESPSPPQKATTSSFLPQKNRSKSPLKRPNWDRSAKIGKAAPPMPKKFVRPTLHGIKVKRGQGGVAKTAMRASMSSLETENGFAMQDRSNSTGTVAQSWDSQQYRGGGNHDYMSLPASSTFVSSTEDKIKESVSDRSSLPRSNGVRYHEDLDFLTAGEDLKPDGGNTETKRLTGEFGRFFSKLRRSSTSLSKPPSKLQPPVTPKPLAVPVLGKLTKANSLPVQKVTSKTFASLHSLNSSGENQTFAIGSYASLKLLQECAQTEKISPNPAYNVHKPRKIRDHEPHIHFYKTISKALDLKLKGFSGHMLLMTL